MPHLLTATSKNTGFTDFITSGKFNLLDVSASEQAIVTPFHSAVFRSSTVSVMHLWLMKWGLWESLSDSKAITNDYIGPASLIFSPSWEFLRKALWQKRKATLDAHWGCHTDHDHQSRLAFSCDGLILIRKYSLLHPLLSISKRFIEFGLTTGLQPAGFTCRTRLEIAPLKNLTCLEWITPATLNR